MSKDQKTEAGIDRLLAVMARLRDRDTGCPWDIEQTFETIAPYTIEEAYEVADAIAARDMGHLRDELGDLLLQVVFHARMAEEADAFDFEAVARGIADKMIHRHPHVFGGADIADAEAQTVAWEEQKARERQQKADAKGSPAISALDGVASALPALMRALKLQRRAARVGFDWPNSGPVFAKVDEEMAELRDVLENGADQQRVADEIGDLLFSVVNLARHLDVDAEEALRGANRKFETRFRDVETQYRSAGRSMADETLADLERAWQRAKGRLDGIGSR